MPHSPVNSWGIAGVCVAAEVLGVPDDSLGGTGVATLPAVSFEVLAALPTMPAKTLMPKTIRKAQPNFFPHPVLGCCCMMIGAGGGMLPGVPIGEPQFGQQATFGAISFPHFVQNMVICEVGVK